MATVAETEATMILAPYWPKAPHWAQWWAVDADGYPHWYESEPNIVGNVWDIAPGTANFRWLQDERKIDAYPAWRQSLRRRP